MDLPWKGLLPSLLLFLPAGAKLFVSDEDVARELVSLDLEFTPCAQDPDGLVCCTLDADGLERLCGIRVDLPTPLTVMARPLNP